VKQNIPLRGSFEVVGGFWIDGKGMSELLVGPTNRVYPKVANKRERDSWNKLLNLILIEPFLPMDFAIIPPCNSGSFRITSKPG
jgi:hypothetical protein